MKFQSVATIQFAEFFKVDYISLTGEKFEKGMVTLNYITGIIHIMLIGEGNRIKTLNAPIIMRQRLSSGENLFQAKDGELLITVRDMTNVPCSISASAPTIVTILQAQELANLWVMLAYPLDEGENNLSHKLKYLFLF